MKKSLVILAWGFVLALASLHQATASPQCACNQRLKCLPSGPSEIHINPICFCQTVTPPTRLILKPSYLVAGLVYAPPGNASVVQYTEENSIGTRTEITATHLGGNELQVEIGNTLGGVGLDVKRTQGTISGRASALQTSITTGSSLAGNMIDDITSHDEDRFLLVMNTLMNVSKVECNNSVVIQRSFRPNPKHWKSVK